MGTVRCRRALAACLAGTVLVVACNGDESSAPTTTAPAGPTTTISQVEGDRQKAQRAVLTPADLPGFSQDAPGTHVDDTELEAAANACFGYNPLLVRLGEADDPRGAASPHFRRGEVLTLGSGVTFAETEDEARAAITALSAEGFERCFSDALGARLRNNPMFADVDVTTARLPNVAVGDESTGYRSTVGVQVSGQAVTIYSDFTFVRVGRGVAVLSGFAIGAPFPEAERNRLVTAITGRMAAR
ncbi:MAG: hypothetical protein M3203_06475 [Actinomycetota bacterium]|nr:hypothetical protein [Actinomycetota bacterium]